MRRRILLVSGFLFMLQSRLVGINSERDQALPGKDPPVDARVYDDSWVSEDLFLAAEKVTSYRLSSGEHVLVLNDRFSMSIGPDRLSGDHAVVWLKPFEKESAGRTRFYYQAQAYLRGHPLAKKAKGPRSAILRQAVIDKGSASVAGFQVRGRIFVGAEKREAADPRGLAFYTHAVAAVTASGMDLWPWWVDAMGRQSRAEGWQPDKFAEAVTPSPAARAAAQPTDKTPSSHTINIAPVGDLTPQIELGPSQDGTHVITVIGRTYLWWQQPDEKNERSRLLELQADNAVIWRSQPSSIAESAPALWAGTQEDVTALYVCGNVVATEGQRTIRADEVFYDFRSKKGLATNAVLRSSDASRGIPIYIRAAKLKQLADNKFEAENVTLTTSEFHTPQISLNASNAVIEDAASDEQITRAGQSSYDAQMRDVTFKLYDKTVFRWPSVRSNLQRPDVPLKGIRAGNDGTWGTSLETRWFLARLLGLREPEGTNSTFAVDYYSERGLGSGMEINYAEENYFGSVLGYAIYDNGEDQLGRDPTRRDLVPATRSRGRFRFQHRQFLPYGWQLSAEASYLSDQNFLEQYYRNEFNTGKEQETLVHLKRIEDNWGLSLLGKARINEFSNEVQEVPSAEFHWTGQSFWDDKFTFYNDSQISRFHYRFGAGPPPTGPQNYFTFMSTRNELDMPVPVGQSKVVPFAAGTLAYDDGNGFNTDIDGSKVDSQDGIWIGEAGVRMSAPQYWKVYPDVKSRLWDLNQLRHTIQPHAIAVAYAQSDSAAQQRDVLNLGIDQRWQTKRGPADKQSTVDWIHLNLDFTCLSDPGDTSAGPDRFIWNKPFIPLAGRSGRVLPPRDRRSTDIFGPRRNYVGADLTWRLSDTTSVLSDASYDTQSGVVQQLNIGFSRLCWPNLSYYIGSRYLKRFENGFGQKGSNAFTFAAAYVLDPRYTVVFSQQYDFDYGANIRSDITLIRKYHRVYFGLTFSADESLDQNAVVVSLWPEGVSELAVGLGRYMGFGGSTDY